MKVVAFNVVISTISNTTKYTVNNAMVEQPKTIKGEHLKQNDKPDFSVANKI